MILAGDIGGTNTRLALFPPPGTPTAALAQPTVEKIYPSRGHAGLEEIVAEFRAEFAHAVTAACFGIAGPVIRGVCQTPNLPWVVKADSLASQLGLKSAGLINDLEANAHGLRTLGDADLLTLNHGKPDAAGNAGLISAGTGLGEAGLYWDGTRHHPFACEGGHTDFAPRTEQEFALLQSLRPIFGRVSYERVLSGPGLVNIYRYFRGEDAEKHLEKVKADTNLPDPGAAVSKAGLDGLDAHCVQALDLFVSIYGGEAGNLALKLMATGGMYVGGGIAPKILAKLKQPAFLEAFTDKGRMRGLLEGTPVRVVLNDRTALRGSARFAADKLLAG
jgi:glucokinase